MPREAPLPPEWIVLYGRVRYVQRHSATEYSCTCPRCGGEIHEDGTWPDRCRLFLDNRPRLWCRRCGLVAWPNQFGADASFAQPTHEQLEKWRQEEIIKAEARKRSAERALAHLRDEKLWQRYHEMLEGDERARAYWCKRGIPNAWQDFWQLGWCSDYTVWNDGTEYHTATATIPLFDSHWQPTNVKHRLIRPPHENDKYRYEITGQGASNLYLTDPDAPLTGPLVAIEGEIKAMVVKATLDDMTTVVGLPGVTPGAEIIKTLQGAEAVTVVLDPGSWPQARRIAQEVGRQKTRVLVSSTKIDDALINMEGTRYDVQQWLSQAVQV